MVVPSAKRLAQSVPNSLRQLWCREFLSGVLGRELRITEIGRDEVLLSETHGTASPCRRPQPVSLCIAQRMPASLLRSTVHLVAATDPHHKHTQCVVLNVGNHALIAYPVLPKLAEP